MTTPDNTTRNSRIIEMFKAGKYFSEIAATLGVSRGTVAGVCERARRIPKPKPPTAAEILAGIDTSGMTLPGIAHALGKSLPWAKKWVSRLKLPYKMQPVGQAAVMYGRNGQYLAPEAKKIQVKALPAKSVMGLKAVPQDPNPMGCRFITGEPGDPDHSYCGEMREAAAKPYCAHHRQLCTAPHVAPADRQSEAA